MSFNFLNRLSNARERIGVGNNVVNSFGIQSSTGTSSIATPGDGYKYYTWSAPGTGASTGSAVFGNTAGTPTFQTSTRNRSVFGTSTVNSGGAAYVEGHGGGGNTGGQATGTFPAAMLATDNPGNWYVDIGKGGPPNGGAYAAFFASTSAQQAASYLIAGGGGSTGGAGGGTGGGTSGNAGNGAVGYGGPGPAGGGAGGQQTAGGSGGHGAPGRCPGLPGSALQGGPLGGGDPSGRPGGGGGAGYYGGGAGGCGYSGNNNNAGGGGGGGSGYIHPDVQGGTNTNGNSQSGARLVVRIPV